ncbi:Envelope glycoprotein N [Caprine alphaherpesvirus 1]|uniref:Envelope glycoprotein N n=1 Tax=Caprine alphaherpesvirus 1 TaxID=39944 RepID=A0AAE5YI25_9ALPH|nr:Envelope glycoprotein N [Caprine alphaherpesvirus 1]QBM10851.1 Envelope glycoprotein N [Caprine alphaherpesvirus 1]
MLRTRAWPLAACAALALLAIACARDPLLDVMRSESAMDFWSAACYARGIPFSEPPHALVLFYLALVAVVLSAVAYAYGLCLRLVGPGSANKRGLRRRG